jgi:hypothetical protein
VFLGSRGSTKREEFLDELNVWELLETEFCGVVWLLSNFNCFHHIYAFLLFVFV